MISLSTTLISTILFFEQVSFDDEGYSQWEWLCIDSSGGKWMKNGCELLGMAQNGGKSMRLTRNE